MHEGVSLHDLAVLGVEDLRVTCEDNVVDDVSAIVHLSLDKLIALRFLLF